MCQRIMQQRENFEQSLKADSAFSYFNRESKVRKRKVLKSGLSLLSSRKVLDCQSLDFRKKLLLVMQSITKRFWITADVTKVKNNV